MRRLFALGLLVASASLSMGCAMCCSPYDYAYGYYGGAWQRDNLCNGRVGSVYAPAGSPVIATKQQGKISSTEEPSLLPPPAEAAPQGQPEKKPQTKPDDMSTSRPLKSVKRTRPARSYLPENE